MVLEGKVLKNSHILCVSEVLDSLIISSNYMRVGKSDICLVKCFSQVNYKIGLVVLERKSKIWKVDDNDAATQQWQDKFRSEKITKSIAK